MISKIIQSILLIPLAISITTQKAILSESKNYIDEVLEETEDELFIDYSQIDELILNNEELKSLQKLEKSSNFNLSSKISQRYPSIDLQALGLPQYTAGKSYNSNSLTTKTSQFSANPSVTIRWDLVDPLRGSDIKIARDNYKIAKNNVEIKRKDLIKEARARYHNYQKSFQDIENKKLALDLSITSLNNAQSKLDAGIGTKFEILEADAQLSRDEQALSEKKIEHEINKIGLKEILNIRGKFKIKPEQKIIGFWNYKLNKNLKDGLAKNLSLENLTIQRRIRNTQATNYLNSQKPIVYLSNTFSSAFTKGDAGAFSIDGTESGSSYTNTISLNFSLNIFDGGQNKNSYKSSKAQASSELYSYNNFRNLLQANIRKAYLNLKLNEERILSSLKEVSSTNESLRLSRLRYDVGISTLKDVLIRQKELSDAKSKQINAIYNYNLNLDELERLTFLEINKKCIDKDDTQKGSICQIPK